LRPASLARASKALSLLAGARRGAGCALKSLERSIQGNDRQIAPGLAIRVAGGRNAGGRCAAELSWAQEVPDLHRGNRVEGMCVR
jgi:hypothetical protein